MAGRRSFALIPHVSPTSQVFRFNGRYEPVDELSPDECFSAFFADETLVPGGQVYESFRPIGLCAGMVYRWPDYEHAALQYHPHTDRLGPAPAAVEVRCPFFTPASFFLTPFI